MDLKTYNCSSLSQYLSDNKSFLSENEVPLTMMLVDICDCLSSPKKDPVYAFSFLNHGVVVGVASLQQGFNTKLVLSSTLGEECIELLQDNITSRNLIVSTVLSSPEPARLFAHKWCCDSPPKVLMTQQLYFLSREMLREPASNRKGENGG
eukprot:TRINITY_DN16871_c0_g1_i1.p1 TRINITY_DN16871_c0_g1~~TRINITY_DN16871_c0_g1_i1.p1  ORF type:complete len:151 (-),score=21.33 TRINITY_DN16871_c0_g1_i1:441-893(-)